MEMSTEERKTIFFDEETSYEMNGTKYIVISHFDDKGENMLDKMARLLKSDIRNTANQNL